MFRFLFLTMPNQYRQCEFPIDAQQRVLLCILPLDRRFHPVRRFGVCRKTAIVLTILICLLIYDFVQPLRRCRSLSWLFLPKAVFLVVLKVFGPYDIIIYFRTNKINLSMDLPAMLRSPETLYLLRVGIAMQAGVGY